MIQRKIEEEQRQLEKNPAHQYVNGDLPFPQLLRLSSLNDYGVIDNHLYKIGIELAIMEEQDLLQSNIKTQIESGVSTMMTPEGARLMTKSELLTQYRMCDVTKWVSKGKIEKELQDMIKFIGVQTPQQSKPMMTPEEHNELAIAVVQRASKYGIRLFDSNKDVLIAKIKN